MGNIVSKSLLYGVGLSALLFGAKTGCDAVFYDELYALKKPIVVEGRDYTSLVQDVIDQKRMEENLIGAGLWGLGLGALYGVSAYRRKKSLEDC